MPQRRRRIWIAVTIIALIGIATIVNYMGDGIAVTMRGLHGQP